MITMRTEHTAIGGMKYNRCGSGPALILVHGLGSCKEVWDPLVDLLADVRDVIAVDLPGFGSSPLAGPCRVDTLVDRVEKLIEELGLDGPEVAGNSMGGAIALELARRRVASSATAFSPIGLWNTPELWWCQTATRTLHLFLTKMNRLSVGLLTRQPGKQLLRLMFGKPGNLSESQLRMNFTGVQRATGFTEAVGSFADYRFHRGTELDSIPVTIAWGSRDILLPWRSQSRRARSALPKATHVTLTGSGHVPFTDDPITCANILRRATQR